MFLVLFIVFPYILNVIAVVISLFFDLRWEVLKDIIIGPIFGTLMWVVELLQLKYIIFILFFSVIFLFGTFYFKKLRNIYFILPYFTLSYFIFFGKEIYYFLLDQNNTIHSDTISESLIAIFISSFIFNYLLKKYLWKRS